MILFLWSLALYAPWLLGRCTCTNQHAAPEPPPLALDVSNDSSKKPKKRGRAKKIGRAKRRGIRT
jgi:hypothetical protein